MRKVLVDYSHDSLSMDLVIRDMLTREVLAYARSLRLAYEVSKDNDWIISGSIG